MPIRREDFPISHVATSIVGTRDRNSRAPAEAQQGRTSAGRRRQPPPPSPRPRLPAQQQTRHRPPHPLCNSGSRAAAAPVGPPPPKPDIPVVVAAKARKKIPFWAFATLSTLPLWAFMYVRALTPTTERIPGPLGDGALLYSAVLQLSRQQRRGCLRARLPFSQQEVLKTFPHIEDQLRWVYGGTDAYFTAGVADLRRPESGGRPAHHQSTRHHAWPGRSVDRRTRSSPLCATSDSRSAVPIRWVQTRTSSTSGALSIPGVDCVGGRLGNVRRHRHRCPGCDQGRHGTCARFVRRHLSDVID